MLQNLVIIGSASLQEKISHWKKYWESEGFEITDYPRAISEENFLRDYSSAHEKFFMGIEAADVAFVLNEDKNGAAGYIGAESYAEMAFAVAQNLIHGKNIEVMLLQMPDRSVQCYDEVALWLKLGWIKLFKK